MSNLPKKEKGFTLIEIVLVLAIAGLIMVIVFLALSGAQRARRDTQRRQDLGRVASLLESFASDNNGCYPDSATAPGCAGTAPWSGAGSFIRSTYITGANLVSPSTGAAYTYNANAFPAAPAQDTIYYKWGVTCNGTAGNRYYEVEMGLEAGIDCRDNL